MPEEPELQPSSPEENSDPPSPPEEPQVGDPGMIMPGIGELDQKDDQTLSMLGHILGGCCIFLAPLLLWLLKKDKSPFMDDQGKEALNFSITLVIGQAIAWAITQIPILGCVLFVLPVLVWTIGVIYGIIGGIESNKGVLYRYPFNFRFIS